MNYTLTALTISLCIAVITTGGCSTRVAVNNVDPVNPDVRVFINEGSVALEIQDLQLADQKFSAALEYARRIGDNAGIAVTLAGLAEVYLGTQKYPEALEALHTALPYYERNKYLAAKARVLRLIGFAEHEMGNVLHAVSSYDQSLTISDELLGFATGQEKRVVIESRGATLFLKAEAHKKLEQFGDAVESYRRAAQDDKAIGDDNSAGVALWLAATIVEVNLKDQEQAMGLYAEAVPLLLKANKQKEAAWASVSLGEIYVEAGKYVEAREVLLNSVKLGENLDLPNVTFRAHWGLTTVFENSGDIPQTLSHYAAVIDHIRQGKEKADEIYLHALREAGTLYRLLGKYELSIEHIRAAAVMYREKQDTKMEGAMLAQLAELHFWVTDFETAIDLYKRTLELFRKYKTMGDDAEIRLAEVQILAALGETLAISGKGRPDEITKYFEDGRAIIASLVGGDLLKEAADARNISAQEESKVIKNWLQRLTSVDIRVRLTAGILFQKWGRIYVAAGEYLDRAKTLLSIALAYHSYAQDRDNERADPNGLIVLAQDSYFFGEALRKNKELGQALQHFLIAESLAEQLGTPEIHFIYSGIARTYADMNDSNRAVSYYKKGLALLESIQSHQGTEALKIGAFAGALYAYRGLVKQLLALHTQTKDEQYLQEAFQYTERIKARAFLETFTKARIARSEDEIGRFTSTEEKLRIQMDFIHEQLRNVKGRASEEKTLVERLERLRQEREKVRQTSVGGTADSSDTTTPRLLQLAELQAALDENSVVLEYSLSDQGLILWAIAKDKFKVFDLPLAQAQLVLEDYLKTLREPLITRGELSKHVSMGTVLYRALIKPAEAVLQGKSQLIIVPEGPLFYLPFETLIVTTSQDEAKNYKALGEVPYLLKQFQVSYFPSASVLFTQRRELQQNRKEQLPILAFGDPIYTSRFSKASVGEFQSVGNTVLRDSNFNRLEYSGDEVRRIAGIWGISSASEHINLRERATLARVRELDLTQYRIIHFATHAVAGDRVGWATQPALVLSQQDDGSQGGGYLQLSDILALKLNAELVVLSACETGLGTLHDGEGILGLTRAFLYAGAASAVVSLWKVEDQSTSLLMEKFYQWLKKGSNKAEALRQAKLEILNSKIELKALGDVQSLASPFFWAPFILIGDPAPLRN
jgi:CHAT domain-containing protein